MTEKQLAILTLVVAVFACIAAYLVIPQVQQWINQSLTPTHSAKPIATSTSIPPPTSEVNMDVLVQTAVAGTITVQQSATTAALAAVPTLTSTAALIQLTSQTLTFTSTPLPPTATPNLPPTPVQTTEPGIILEDGDTAIGDGLMLKASFFCVLDCDFEYDYTPAQIAVDFILRNVSDKEYILPDIPSDGLLIKLDTGDRLYVWSNIRWAEKEEFIEQQMIHPGEEISWRWIFRLSDNQGGGVGQLLTIPGTSRSFTLSFPEIWPRFTGAQWKGEIPR